MAKNRDYTGKLYDTFKDQMEGFTKTEPEFRKALESPEYKKKVYSTLVEQMDGFSRKEDEFYSLIEKKNPKSPTESSGTGVSMVGNGNKKAPIGVASQEVLNKAGIKPSVQPQKTTSTEIVKEAIGVAKKQGEVIAKQPKVDDRNVFQKAGDIAVETLTSGVAQMAGGIAGLIGAGADLLIDKTPEKAKDATILSNEWFKGFLAQKGEVKNPSWYTNQGIRDNFMAFANAMNTISQGESEIAKSDIGVKDVQKSPIDHILEGNYKDAAKSALVEVAQQIPNLALMYGTGGSSASLGVMGATSAGSNLTNQYNQDGDISQLDLAQGLAVGVAEFVSEKFFDLDNNAAKVLGGKVYDLLGTQGKALQKEIQEKGADFVKEKLIRSISDVFKKTGAGTGQEIFEETIVSTVDYLTSALDEDVLNKDGFNKFLKEIGNNTIVSGITGGGMSLMAASASYKPLTTIEKETISRYQEILNDPNASKSVKNIAAQKIGQINDGTKQSEALHDQIVALPLIDRVDIIGKLNRVSDIRAEAENIMDVDIKDAMLEKAQVMEGEVNAKLKEFNIVNENEVKPEVKLLTEEELSKNINQDEKLDFDVINNRIKTIEKFIEEEGNNSFYDETLAQLQKEKADFISSMSEKYANNKPQVQQEIQQEAQQEETPESIAAKKAVIKTTNDFIEQKLPTSDKIQDIESRMNNADLIDEKEIAEATDGLYELLDEVDNLDVNEEVKQGMISAIEDKIKKIEGYEFETTTETIKPEQKRKVLISKQVIGETKRGTKNKGEVTKDRFVGKDASVNNTNGEITYDKNTDVLTISSFDGKTKKDLDFNYLEYSESMLDEKGAMQGVILTDTRNGDNVKIFDEELAYDIAIKEQIRQIGEVSDAVFDEVYQTITTPAVTQQVIKPKPNSNSNNGSATPPPLPPTSPASTPPISPPPPPSNPSPGKGTPITPEQADADGRKMMVDTENELLKKGKIDWWSKFKRYVTNRKTDLDRELNKTEKGQKARKFNENISGSVSYADEQFQEAEAAIYGDVMVKIDKGIGKIRLKINKAFSNISYEKEVDLNLAIFLKRVINIDENTIKQNEETQKRIDDLKTDRLSEKDPMKKIRITNQITKEKGRLKEPVKHPRGFNLEKAKAALEGMRRRVGDEAFADINKRSDAYAEVRREMLLEMTEEGLISEETFDRLVSDSYIERKFLDHIFDNQNFSSGDSLLPSQMIKSLAGGSEELLLTDSRLLLHAGYRSLQSRIATNRANKILLEAISDGGIDPNFGRIAKFKKNLDGTHKIDSKTGTRIIEDTPTGMVLIPSYEKGERGGVFVKQEYAEQWNDIVKITTVLDPYLKSAMGVKTLKTAATLMNPLFAAGNVMRDFFKVIFLSDTYDNNLITSIPRLLLNFSGKASQYTAYKFGLGTDSFRLLVDDYTKYGGKFEFLHQDGKNTRLYKNSINRNKSNFSKVKSGAFNLFENAMGLPGEISEISMRLAIFDKKRSELFERAGGKDKLSDDEIKEVNILAANASRAVMDYNKGGLATKYLDNFSPYLNASVVGFVSDADYIKKNPKMVAAKMAIFGLHVAALTLWNLINGDEEDYANIPQYVKDNNFIFFIPGKFDDGKRYYVLPKYQGLQMPAAMFEEATIAMWNSLKDANYGKKDSTANRAMQTLSTWSPIPFTPKGVMQKMPPAFSAGVAYFGNYDFYRDQTVEYKKGEIPIQLEGLDNKKIARTYKVIGDLSSKLGDDFALSPSRTQASVEKIITNPRTNFLVGNLYGISDWITKDYQIPMEIEKSDPNSTKASIKNKFIRTVDPRYAEKANDFSKKEDMKIKAEEQYQKKMIRVMVNNGEPTKKVVEFITNLDISDAEKETRAKMYKDLLNEKLISAITPFYDELLDIRYLQVSPEGKAQSFYNRFHGIDPASDDFKSIIDSAEKMKIISKGNKNGGIKAGSSYERFVKEYVRIYQSKKTDTK